MADQRIGEMLRSRREQIGMSISQAAQQTNIRPRVLESFEAGDYKNFPPHGYATGMLSSYARCLGLDPRIILMGYEEELAAFEHKADVAAEADAKVAGTKSTKTSRFSRNRSKNQKPTPEPTQTGQFDPMMTGEIDTGGDIARATSAIKVVERSSGRSSGRKRGAHSMSSSAGRRVAASASATNPGGSRLDAYRDSMRDRYASDRKPLDINSEAATTGRISTVSTGRFTPVKSAAEITPNTGRISNLAQTGNLPESVKEELEAEPDDYTVRGGRRYSPRSRTGANDRQGRRNSRPDESLISRIRGSIGSVLSDRHSRLIAVAIVLAVVAVIIVASMLLNSAGKDDTGILDVTGGGQGTSSTDVNDDGDGKATATITTANGNPVVISINVDEGATSLISITYDDDNAYSGTAVGPWYREFQVTETMTAVFGTPSAVTVLENGEPIEIPEGEDGTGTLTVNVQAEGLATG